MCLTILKVTESPFTSCEGHLCVCADKGLSLSLVYQQHHTYWFTTYSQNSVRHHFVYMCALLPPGNPEFPRKCLT